MSWTERAAPLWKVGTGVSFSAGVILRIMFCVAWGGAEWRYCCFGVQDHRDCFWCLVASLSMHRGFLCAQRHSPWWVHRRKQNFSFAIANRFTMIVVFAPCHIFVSYLFVRLMLRVGITPGGGGRSRHGSRSDALAGGADSKKIILVNGKQRRAKASLPPDRSTDRKSVDGASGHLAHSEYSTKFENQQSGPDPRSLWPSRFRSGRC